METEIKDEVATQPAQPQMPPPTPMVDFEMGNQKFRAPVVFLTPADPIVRQLYAMLGDLKARIDRLEVNQVSRQINGGIR